MSYLGPKALGDFADSSIVTLTGTQALTNKTVNGRDPTADGAKLDGIEASADVTDTTNVTAAGALMDSEVTNLAQVKAFDSSDYATAAQGTTADAALPKTGGAMSGAITTNSTFDGRDVSVDGTKLDGIEASADVTDATNVAAAGALMTTGGAMTGDIDLGQNNKALFGGTGGDLEIYHDGNSAYIDNNDGLLFIRNNVDGDDGSDIYIQAKSGENSVVIQDDGGTLIYYDASLKFRTQSYGIDVYGYAKARGVEETVYNFGTTSGTITPNFALGAIQKITLNGNLTFNAFTSPAAGQSITLIIDTNGTNRTLTSTMKFAGGNKTMSTTDTIDVMTVLYDGTNYLANYVTDFS